MTTKDLNIQRNWKKLISKLFVGDLVAEITLRTSILERSSEENLRILEELIIDTNVKTFSNPERNQTLINRMNRNYFNIIFAYLSIIFALFYDLFNKKQREMQFLHFSSV